MLGGEVRICFVAGIATAASFFTYIGKELQAHFNRHDTPCVIDIVFPYGDQSRSVMTQLLEVQSDMRVTSPARKHTRSAKRARDQILAGYEGENLILIGHSAGGVAAYLTDHLLRSDQIFASHIIQIGSPKIRVRKEDQARVAYLQAKNNRRVDPISILGTWGGVHKSAISMPVWTWDKYAPARRRQISLIGGHADYFRKSPAFVDQHGISNLAKTMRVITDWIT